MSDVFFWSSCLGSMVICCDAISYEQPILDAKIFLNCIVGAASEPLTACHSLCISIVDRLFQSSAGRRGLACVTRKGATARCCMQMQNAAHHFLSIHAMSLPSTVPSLALSDPHGNDSVASADVGSKSPMLFPDDASPIVMRRVRFGSPSPNTTRVIDTSLRDGGNCSM